MKIIQRTWLSRDATKESLKKKANSGENAETLQSRIYSGESEAYFISSSGFATRRAVDMSKYLKQAEKVSIPRHRHCIVCATPVAMEREFCGSTCEDQFKRAERKRKYMMVVPILLIFPFFLLIILLGHR